MNRSDIQNNIYTSLDLPLSASYVDVTDTEKSEASTIASNFFSFIVSKHL